MCGLELSNGIFFYFSLQKLVMGSKEWMDAHLTAVLDKAKMTRQLCQMG
jgi:hypothetical protein